MDPEQYYAKYPIGSRWLLPVTVAAHLTPAHDDYDPRPIKLAYKPDAGALYPRCRDLPELIPAAEQTAPPSNNSTISVTLTLTPTQYATLCTALLHLQ